MLDAIGELLGILIGIAVICFIIYFAMFVVIKTFSSILYFFKWRKLTPAERAYEKRIRNRYPSSKSSNGWWSFDSGGSSGGSDCGDSGGDGGGGGD